MHSRGQLLPIFPGEQMWNPAFRGTLYFFAMVYCFMGIALIADRFMVAIEVITSKEKVVRVRNEVTGDMEDVHILVWNATVANLTLMALGSSAPEILMALSETILTLGMEPEEG